MRVVEPSSPAGSAGSPTSRGPWLQHVLRGEGRAWWLAIGSVVLLTIGLRVGVVVAVHRVDADRAVVRDTPTYVDPARALVEDGAYDRAPGSDTPEFVRTPGYPVFIAAVRLVAGDSEVVLLVVQAALSSLSVLLAILLARRLTGSAGIALAVGLMLALDPVHAILAGTIVTEALATVLVTLTAYCLARLVEEGLSGRWAALSALALVAATYVRPTTYYFPLVLAAVLAGALLRNADHDRRRALARATAALVVPCVVILGAWNLRNHAEVGSWRFSGVEAINTYWYRAAGIVAERDGIGFEEARLRLTEDLNDGPGPDVDAAGHSHGTLPPAWEDRQGEYYDRASQAGLEILRSEPPLWAEQFVRGVYSQLVQSGWGGASEYLAGRDAPAPVAAASLAYIWGIEALALAGMATSLRRPSPHRLAHVLLVALVAYCIAAGAGPDAAAGWRFRVPLWPIWCTYALVGLRELTTRLGRHRPSRSLRPGVGTR